MTKTPKNAVIIGAGAAGITASIYLARAGYTVNVFERNSIPGGRCGQITKDDHRFDIGPTMLMMPDVLENIFKDFGRDLHKELSLERLEPGYHIKMQGKGEFVFSSDMKSVEEQLEKIEKGSYQKYRTYMSKSYQRYRLSMKKVVNKNYYSFFRFFTLRNFILFLKLKAFHNHYRFTSRYFKNEFLRIAFTLQNLYLGQNPYKSPALFSILPAMELEDGIWFPKGGMYAIVEKLVEIAEKEGVLFSYNTPVTKIISNANHVVGIECSGKVIKADLVISNADIPFTYKNLLNDIDAKRFDKMKYSCSAFVFHWGVSRQYPQLEQHNVFVGKDFRNSMRHIFNAEKPYSVPDTFYIHAPGQTDETAAPKNEDSYTVIVQTNNLSQTKEDWNKLKADARAGVIKRLKAEGLTDIEEHIKFEICFTPRSWESKFNLTHGSTFGSLAHNLLQMGYFRPGNQDKKRRNLFFTGACTHPGSGLPLAITSGKLVCEKIFNLEN